MLQLRKKGKQRGRLHDEVLSSLAARTRDFLPMEESKAHGATLESFQQRIGERFTYMQYFLDGTISVRTELLGRKIHWGYFKPSNSFSAARYADMVAVKVWIFKHREAIPPVESKLNFRSRELADADWITYADTYGQNITDILDRLQVLGMLKESENYVPPRRISEMSMDLAKANYKAVETLRGELANRLDKLDSLIEAINKRLGVIEDRLAAKSPARVILTSPPITQEVTQAVTQEDKPTATDNPQDAWA